MARQRRTARRCKGNRRRANRGYKDRLFIRIFEGKEDLLQLYNAVNDSDYQNRPQLVPQGLLASGSS